MLTASPLALPISEGAVSISANRILYIVLIVFEELVKTGDRALPLFLKLSLLRLLLSALHFILRLLLFLLSSFQQLLGILL